MTPLGDRDGKITPAGDTIVRYRGHPRDLHLGYGNTFGVISGGDRELAAVATFVSSDFYASRATPRHLEGKGTR